MKRFTKHTTTTRGTASYRSAGCVRGTGAPASRGIRAPWVKALQRRSEKQMLDFEYVLVFLTHALAGYMFDEPTFSLLQCVFSWAVTSCVTYFSGFESHRNRLVDKAHLLYPGKCQLTSWRPSSLKHFYRVPMNQSSDSCVAIPSTHRSICSRRGEAPANRSYFLFQLE